jgi:hypothetical protein
MKLSGTLANTLGADGVRTAGCSCCRSFLIGAAGT